MAYRLKTFRVQFVAEPAFYPTGSPCRASQDVDRIARSIYGTLARISHNGIILRVASPENTFTSVIRGDQHYCHGDRQAIGRRLQRFGFARADSPIRRRSYSLVADSADNPQISAA